MLNKLPDIYSGARAHLVHVALMANPEKFKVFSLANKIIKYRFASLSLTLSNPALSLTENIMIFKGLSFNLASLFSTLF